MGKGRGLALYPQELDVGGHLHDFIGSEQIAAREVVAEAGVITGLAALGLEPGGFLADHLAQPFGRFKIIHPENLLHSRIGDEGICAFAVEVLELAHILQDRPDLQSIARHQTRRAVYGLQTAQGSKFTEQGRVGAFRLPMALRGAVGAAERSLSGREGALASASDLMPRLDALEDL